MAREGRTNNTLYAAKVSPFSISHFSGVRRKMRRQRLIVQEDIRVWKGDHFFLWPYGVTTEEAKQRALTRHTKSKFTHLPISSHILPAMTTLDTTTIFEMDPMIGVGLPELRVLRRNPPLRLAPPRANRVRDKVPQRMASSWRYLEHHRGDLAFSTLYLSPVQEVSITPRVG
jgi:hypothetical protein